MSNVKCHGRPPSSYACKTLVAITRTAKIASNVLVIMPAIELEYEPPEQIQGGGPTRPTVKQVGTGTISVKNHYPQTQAVIYLTSFHSRLNLY